MTYPRTSIVNLSVGIIKAALEEKLRQFSLIHDREDVIHWRPEYRITGLTPRFVDHLNNFDFSDDSTIIPFEITIDKEKDIREEVQFIKLDG